MRTLIITAVWAAFLFGLYTTSHAVAIVVGVLGLIVILAEGNWRSGRLRRRRT